jgi:hypothetical protein
MENSVISGETMSEPRFDYENRPLHAPRFSHGANSDDRHRQNNNYRGGGGRFQGGRFNNSRGGRGGRGDGKPKIPGFNIAIVCWIRNTNDLDFPVVLL